MSHRPIHPLPPLPCIALALSLAGGWTGCSGASATSPEVLAASPRAEVRLGNAPVRVSLALPASAESQVEARTARGEGRLRLVIEGLQLLHPGAVYEVYLNLPAGQPPVPDNSARVGNLSLFTDPESSGEITRSFDITDRVKALRQRRQWSGQVELTFVRENLAGPRGGPAAPPGSGDFLRFTRVSILAR
jgi:hypothetical protein